MNTTMVRAFACGLVVLGLVACGRASKEENDVTLQAAGGSDTAK